MNMVPSGITPIMQTDSNKSTGARTDVIPAMNKSAILLGVGILNWPRIERVTDRYGVVTLSPSGHDCVSSVQACRYQALTPGSVAGVGRLVAIVIETRKSGHIGDLFHQIFPRTPKIGQRIILGKGRLFFQVDEAVVFVKAVGLEPLDGRHTQWLKIRALFDCHDQTVELWFDPS